jgi:hypothetical protein
MVKKKAEIKEWIDSLSKSELAEIVLKLSARKEIFNFLSINYFDKQSGEIEFYNQTLAEIDILYGKRYKGFSEQLRLANMLAACNKKVNEFTQTSTNKKLEADMLMYILDDVFVYYKDLLGTCFTTFDTKVGFTLRRLINLIKKMHPDYLLEYQDKVNSYLEVLHTRSNHINTIYNMPKSI